MFDRKVTRIITPGTLIDERFMDTTVNNFLLAIHPQQSGNPIEHHCRQLSSEAKEDAAKDATLTVGLAWIDLSTGDFYTQSIEMPSLSSAIARIGPREIILGQSIETAELSKLAAMIEQEGRAVNRHTSRIIESNVAAWQPFLEDEMSSTDADLFSTEEVSAGSCLLDYIEVQLQGLKTKLQAPIRRPITEAMSIDRNSMRALEIKQTLRDGFTKGSLLHTMRKTVTNSGARLLNDWLTAPSTSIAIINGRLDLASYFLEKGALREQITRLLGRTFDSQRLVQKFSLGRGDPDDLIALCKTIQATENIAATLAVQTHLGIETQAPAPTPMTLGSCIEIISRRFNLEHPRALADRIAASIDEDGLYQTHEREEAEAAGTMSLAQAVTVREDGQQALGSLPARRARAKSFASLDGSKSRYWEEEDVWVMKKDASDLLKRLHDRLEGLRAEKLELETELRVRYAAGSLTLRWTPGLGHICHVKGKDTQSSLSNHETAKSVSASKSTRSLHLPEWTRLGGRIDQVRLQIKLEEQHVFRLLRDEVIQNLVKLRRNATVLDELDVACSFALSAETHNLVRPVLTSGQGHRIIGGRHPTVERGLEEQGRNFISNDCSVGENERIWLITGPNMAGKSTFLRQNALISIMAQAGSYVPADYAEIGIVDQIFSRIGSADDLYQDQSTFMVEMLETAAILRQATSRSFVIMDEVGRGTTSEDGIAVGYACLEHLYHVNRCRTLFATHFHTLADMTKDLKDLKCYCTDVAEDDAGGFSYVHRLREGVNRQSHALKVARLAGIPERAIGVAAEVIKLQGCVSSRSPILSS